MIDILIWNKLFIYYINLICILYGNKEIFFYFKTQYRLREIVDYPFFTCRFLITDEELIDMLTLNYYE